MDLMLLILVGALVVLAAPFVAGALVSRSRKRSLGRILADLAEGRRLRGDVETSFLPLLPRVPIAAIAAEPAGPVDLYEYGMTKALAGCADALQAALDHFAAQAREHYGSDYVQPMRLEGRQVKTWASPEIALLRLRGGIYEPAIAYRPGQTPTAWLDLTSLRRLFAAEDMAAAFGS